MAKGIVKAATSMNASSKPKVRTQVSATSIQNQLTKLNRQLKTAKNAAERKTIRLQIKKLTKSLQSMVKADTKNTRDHYKTERARIRAKSDARRIAGQTVSTTVGEATAGGTAVGVTGQVTKNTTGTNQLIDMTESSKRANGRDEDTTTEDEGTSSNSWYDLIGGTGR